MAFWSKNSKAEQPPAPKTPSGQNGTAGNRQLATEAPRAKNTADAKEGKAASARLLLRFGEVVSVLMRTPQFGRLPLTEVRALVVPPLISGQFLVAEAQSKSQGFITPVATALWAKVSKEVDQRLSQDLDKPIRLAPNEWKCGEIPWLIVLAGNPQAIAPMLKQFQETTLKGQPLKMRARDKNGKAIVRTFGGKSA